MVITELPVTEEEHTDVVTQQKRLLLTCRIKGEQFTPEEKLTLEMDEEEREKTWVTSRDIKETEGADPIRKQAHVLLAKSTLYRQIAEELGRHVPEQRVVPIVR